MKGVSQVPGTTDDDQNDILDDEPEGDEPEGDEGNDEPEGDEPDGDEEPQSDKKSSKRISDLQSKADREAARANKAEKALAALKRDGSGSGANDPATQALMTELREASLDAIFGEFPELREYGIDRSLIEGTTRAELRQSATSLVGLIKSVQTKARNRALAEHGIKAEPAGSRRTAPVDYASMSDEDFEKVLASIN